MKRTTYRDSGVDIGKADRLIHGLKGRIERTFTPHVLSPIGGFGSLIEVPPGYREPVLVSSTDGVGTKLRIAFMSGKHDTVGIDLVAMSVNDILTLGAKPLYFLDYFACGTIDEGVYGEVLSGICAGCEMGACALVGGETAEMPSFYGEGEYELAGFVTGIVEKQGIIDGTFIKAGDRIIGLASNGLHSNGYSLVRRILFDLHRLKVTDKVEGLGDRPLYQELLRPTRIYVRSVMALLEEFRVKGMAHITGGGLPGNVARIIPEGLRAHLLVEPARIDPIFTLLQKMGNVPVEDMYSTFNMGAGFVLVVEASDEEAILKRLAKLGENAFPLGSIEETAKGPKVLLSAPPLPGTPLF
jgi:phosphoribosylformylglycinamidine cyclo-ligase